MPKPVTTPQKSNSHKYTTTVKDIKATKGASEMKNVGVKPGSSRTVNKYCM